jgi:hypothetical protein
VILAGPPESAWLVDEFELRTIDTSASEQATDLARLLLAKLPGLKFDRAALRTAGTPPIARRNKAQFSRAHAEGAVLYVLREHTKRPVPAGDPQAFAKAAGMKKNELIAGAMAISSGKYDAVIPALGMLFVQ